MFAGFAEDKHEFRNWRLFLILSLKYLGTVADLASLFLVAAEPIARPLTKESMIL
jgi:hypothetical protein